MIRKIFIMIVVLLSFLSAGSLSQAIAQQEKEGWYMTTSLASEFPCTGEQSCIDSLISLNESSAVMSWGVKHDTCNGKYVTNGTWSALPDFLVPGNTITSLIETAASETTSCGIVVNTVLDTSIATGKSTPLKNQQPLNEHVEWEVFGSVTASGPLSKGTNYRGEDFDKMLSESGEISWVVPDGADGNRLYVRFDTGATPGPSAQKIFVYEYSRSGNRLSVPARDKSGAQERNCTDSGARFSDFSGHIEYAPATDPNDWDNITEFGLKLCNGDRIKTGIDSTAIITFQDMTVYHMAPESTIIISNENERISNLEILTGQILVNVKRMLKDGSMEVKMSQAVAGIKGTTFVLEEDGVESRMKVLEGTVEFTSLSNGALAIVSAGNVITGTSQGLSEITTFDISAETQNWESLQADSSLPAERPSAWKYALIAGVLIALLFSAGAMVMRKKTVNQ